MLPALSEPRIRSIKGALKGGFGEQIVDARHPTLSHLGQSRCNTSVSHRSIHVILGEQFTGIRPETLERRLHSSVAFPRAVAETHQPPAAIAQVIARFLDRLG